MAKSTAEKLVSNRDYKEIMGSYKLTDDEIMELTLFDAQVGFNHDRAKTISKFIKYGHTGWVELWEKLKTVNPSSYEYHIMLYGDELGNEIYLELNTKKTVKFIHDSVTQQYRSSIAADNRRGKTGISVRSVQYWINQGMSIEEANANVKRIQTTNTIENYIKKYGELGEEKYIARKNSWTIHMNNSDIGKKRSLGLARYIERYGDELGRVKYFEMRQNRNNKYGKVASNESLVAFSDIIAILDKNNIKYYVGVPNNREWCIYNKETEQWFFYDLTIPFLSIIVEYHGESFHPNPMWDSDKWARWTSVYTNKSADICYEYDLLKRRTAEQNGWSVYEIYSSDVETTKRVILEQLSKSGYFQ